MTLRDDIRELKETEQARDILAALNLSQTCIRAVDGTITFWCDGNEQLYGWSRDEAIGRVTHKLLETQFPRPLDQIEVELLQNGSWEGELLHRTKSSAKVWVASRWVLQRNEDGTARCVIEVNNDITSLRRAEETSRDLASIVASSEDAIISKNLDGLVTSWNCAAERLFGYSADEMLGKTILRLFPPELAKEELSILTRVERGERIQHYETVRLAKSGRRIPVSLAVSPVLDAHGRIVGVAKTARDISEKKALERAIRVSEERQRLAVEAGEVGLWSYDANSRIAHGSSRCRQIFGLPSDAPDPVYEDLMALLHHEDAERVDRAFHTSLIDRTGFDVDFRVVDRLGVLHWVQAKGSPRFAPDGRVAEIHGTMIDFTRRKQIEEALTRSNGQLQQFAYSAAHDLQEPLRNVALSIEMARAQLPQKLDPEPEELLKNAVQSACRMEAMVRDLLAYSKILYEEQAESDVSDSNQVLTLALQNLAVAIADTSAKITHDDLPTVKMAQPHLLQLLQNLIGNALKHRASEPPEIHIGVRQNQNGFEFSIADNGPGIEPQSQETVFDVFKRLRKRDTPGTGMGLALCKRIVERYNGQIWIDSDGKSGTRFFFTVRAVKGKSVASGDDAAYRSVSMG